MGCVTSASVGFVLSAAAVAAVLNEPNVRNDARYLGEAHDGAAVMRENMIAAVTPCHTPLAEDLGARRR